MRQASLYRYTLPLQSGLVLKDIQLFERKGLLVHLSEGGREGWGEIAPLPTFSVESLEQAEAAAKIALAAWKKGGDLNLEAIPPSSAFGLSMAHYELHQKLAEKADFSTIPLCTDYSEQTLSRLKDKSLAKLKIGRSLPELDGKMTYAILNALPKLMLRLDANRAWSLEDAMRFAEQLPHKYRQRIAFIEEPCCCPLESIQFAQYSGLQIAWDETSRQAGFNLEKSANVSAVILKPTLVGSVEKCLAIIQQAKKCNLNVVISSSLESSLGLTQLARFAAQYTPHSVSGLDTLNLMTYQLLREWRGSSLPVLNIDNSYIKFVYF